MKPFFSIALKCCSAALADLNPSFLAISALVGGKPLFFMLSLIKSKISCCLAVSYFIFSPIRIYCNNIK